MDDKKFTLLIIFRERDSLFVEGVEAYGTISAERLFYYKKNGTRVFVPIDAVTLFGRADAVYENVGGNENDIKRVSEIGDEN